MSQDYESLKDRSEHLTLLTEYIKTDNEIQKAEELRQRTLARIKTEGFNTSKEDLLNGEFIKSLDKHIQLEKETRHEIFRTLIPSSREQASIV